MDEYRASCVHFPQFPITQRTQLLFCTQGIELETGNNVLCATIKYRNVVKTLIEVGLAYIYTKQCKGFYFIIGDLVSESGDYRKMKNRTITMNFQYFYRLFFEKSNNQLAKTDQKVVF